MISILFLVGVVYLYYHYPHRVFFPVEDTGQIFSFTEAAEGISFESYWWINPRKKLPTLRYRSPNVADHYVKR